jgi:hypothetical protein
LQITNTFSAGYLCRENHFFRFHFFKKLASGNSMAIFTNVRINESLERVSINMTPSKIIYINFSLTIVLLWLCSGCSMMPSDRYVIAPPDKKIPENVSSPEQAPPAAVVAVDGSVNSSSGTPPLRINASRLVTPDSAVNQFLDNDCFVTRWNFLGPFVFAPEQQSAAIHQQQMAEEKSLSGGEPAENRNAYWELMRFNSEQTPGKINLRRIYRDNICHAVAYAVTFILSDTAHHDLSLCVASSDNIKIWLNHKLVHTYDRGPRKMELDQDIVKGVKLMSGYNQIVVKTINSGGSEWSFMLRLAAANNSLLNFKLISDQ